MEPTKSPLLSHICRSVSACRPAEDLAALDGVHLEITVDISAVKKDGFPDTTARIVSENARTLKFDQSGFEDR